jgi:hypothetical protein
MPLSQYKFKNFKMFDSDIAVDIVAIDRRTDERYIKAFRISLPKAIALLEELDKKFK